MIKLGKTTILYFFTSCYNLTEIVVLRLTGLKKLVESDKENEKKMEYNSGWRGIRGSVYQ